MARSLSLEKNWRNTMKSNTVQVHFDYLLVIGQKNLMNTVHDEDDKDKESKK
jgi:hypothetical protein